jgi:transposase
MTISELTLKSRYEEAVRRLGIFTGSGRPREWLPDENAGSWRKAMRPA